ncbi:MAG: mannose-1-phosphate guanylyltransferase/mannose-6-phosphate isomerase [Rhizobiaceae bacterium]|nr:mannose-1-phosphate guanylyltransferase/mannose-6-phosphate isomerase [Rhizobiaceae bacterium]
MSLIVPVILCGGAGSRLWPASRESFPKQLIAFGGRESLLQATLSRVMTNSYAAPLIVAGHEMRFLVAEQVRALSKDATILLEPARRDSCAAIIAAAAHVRAVHGDDALVLVLAADHSIPDAAHFNRTVAEAAPAARAGRIVTFGIVPDNPATGYGYIKPGDVLPGMGPVRTVERFVEKPDAVTAERLVSEGHLWNAGNFLFVAGAFLREARAHAPDILADVQAAVSDAFHDLDFIRLEPEAFKRARAISVDFAIMEKSAQLAVMPSTFRWSDIGSWDAAWQIAEKDADGNSATGDVVLLDAKNTLAYSTGPLTTVIGGQDLIVVATRDAVLVAPRDKAQEVRTLVKALEKAGRAQATEHLRAYRPWGDYEQIDKGGRYQVKRITVKPGGILSLQSHVHRAEHWVVVTGTARVTINDEVKLVGENQSVYIPLGAVHRMENPGKVPLELIEVQSGSYLGEDDIVRYEDVYGRG